MIQKLIDFIKEEDGPTAVEYAIMVALIAVVIIAAVTLLGGRVRDTFTTVSGVIPGGS